jgi:hypothetical protein
MISAINGVDLDWIQMFESFNFLTTEGIGKGKVVPVLDQVPCHEDI